MAKACANIADINKFSESISRQKESVYTIRDSFYNALRDAEAQIIQEKDCAEDVRGRCSQAIQTLQGKIEDLESKLAALEAELAATPPTITVTSTDSEGNTHEEEVPNPAYHALLGEIAEVESELGELQALMGELQELQAKVNEQKDRLDQALQKTQEFLETFNSSIQKMGSNAESTIEKLKRIEQVLQEYLSVRINAPSLSTHSGGTTIGGFGGTVKTQTPLAYNSARDTDLTGTSLSTKGSTPQSKDDRNRGLFKSIRRKMDVTKARKSISSYCKEDLRDVLSDRKKQLNLDDSVVFQDDDQFLRDYVRGGGDPNRVKILNGYNNGRMSYVKNSGVHPAKTAIHEHNHQLSANDDLANGVYKRGISINGADTQVNEALTEFFTKKMMGDDYPPHPDVSYVDNMRCIERMEEGFGLDTLKKAYYNNQPELLEARFDSVMGVGQWKEFSQAMESSDKIKVSILSHMFKAKTRKEE